VGPYLKDPAVFKCPADQSTCLGAARVRSYSMSQAVGPVANGLIVDPGNGGPMWPAIGCPPAMLRSRAATRSGLHQGSQHHGRPVASDIWVLVDEHPDSINDGAFAVQMPTGWPNEIP